MVIYVQTNIKPFVHRTFSVFKVLLFALSTRIRIIITHKLISYKWVKMCTYVHVTTHSDEIRTPEHVHLNVDTTTAEFAVLNVMNHGHLTTRHICDLADHKNHASCTCRLGSESHIATA